MNEFKKSKAGIIGADSNIFCTLGIAMKALKRAGYSEQATQMNKEVLSSSSYEQALNTILDFG